MFPQRREIIIQIHPGLKSLAFFSFLFVFKWADGDFEAFLHIFKHILFRLAFSFDFFIIPNKIYNCSTCLKPACSPNTMQIWISIWGKIYIK